MIKTHELAAEDIEQIEVSVSRSAFRTVMTNHHPSVHLETILSLAAVYGEITFQHIHDPRYWEDPRPWSRAYAGMPPWAHPPAPQPPGKRGRKPLKGKRQRRVQGWARRSDTPWETVEVDWSRGERTQRWICSRTALW